MSQPRADIPPVMSRAEVDAILAATPDGTKLRVEGLQARADGIRPFVTVGILRTDDEGGPMLSAPRFGPNRYEPFFQPGIQYTAIITPEQSVAPRMRLHALTQAEAAPARALASADAAPAAPARPAASHALGTPAAFALAPPPATQREADPIYAHHPQDLPQAASPRVPSVAVTATDFLSVLTAFLGQRAASPAPAPTLPTLNRYGVDLGEANLLALSQGHNKPLWHLAPGFTVARYLLEDSLLLFSPAHLLLPDGQLHTLLLPDRFPAAMDGAVAPLMQRVRSEYLRGPAPPAVAMAERMYADMWRRSVGLPVPTDRLGWIALYDYAIMLLSAYCTASTSYSAGGGRILQAYTEGLAVGTLDYAKLSLSAPTIKNDFSRTTAAAATTDFRDPHGQGNDTRGRGGSGQSRGGRARGR